MSRAWAEVAPFEAFFDKGRNLVTEAEVALRNPSAQHFPLDCFKEAVAGGESSP
jgi:hypothetical protein